MCVLRKPHVILWFLFLSWFRYVCAGLQDSDGRAVICVRLKWVLAEFKSFVCACLWTDSLLWAIVANTNFISFVLNWRHFILMVKFRFVCKCMILTLINTCVGKATCHIMIFFLPWFRGVTHAHPHTHTYCTCVQTNQGFKVVQIVCFNLCVISKHMYSKTNEYMHCLTCLLAKLVRINKTRQQLCCNLKDQNNGEALHCSSLVKSSTSYKYNAYVCRRRTTSKHMSTGRIAR